MPKYDASYFIKFFGKIHIKRWMIGDAGINSGKIRCALGHCGLTGVMKWPKKASALQSVIGEDEIIARINDGFHDKYQQRTPKARILAALRDAKKEGR